MDKLDMFFAVVALFAIVAFLGVACLIVRSSRNG